MLPAGNLLASPVIGRVEGSGAELLETVLWPTWGIFVLDYAANLLPAKDRRRHRRHRRRRRDSK